MIRTLFIAIFLSVSVASHAQVDDDGQAYNAFWQKTDAEFKDPEKSPLDAGKIALFDSVPRFAYDSDYRVEAIWEPLLRQKPFKIETTGERRDTYQKVALIHFEIMGDSLTLAAYQNLDLMRKPEYSDYIFIPFTDKTNGFETYGGGRYLNFSRPEEKRVIIDFNQAYNPYCAYNEGYSCPIPPKENHLEVEINAGARTEK